VRIASLEARGGGSHAGLARQAGLRVAARCGVAAEVHTAASLLACQLVTA
jgi:hypothetical protein